MKIKYLNANYGIEFSLPKDFLTQLNSLMQDKPNKKVAVYSALQFLPKLNEVIDYINNNCSTSDTQVETCVGRLKMIFYPLFESLKIFILFSNEMFDSIYEYDWSIREYYRRLNEESMNVNFETCYF